RRAGCLARALPAALEQPPGRPRAAPRRRHPTCKQFPPEDRTVNATLHTSDGRPMLRFERRLEHPPERVWRAITEPEELAHWFPAQVEIDLRPGGAMKFSF